MTELQGYDAILGMAWLRQVNPRIDWRERRIAVLEGLGRAWRAIRPLLAQEAPAERKPCLLNAKQLHQLHHDGQIDEVFAVRVRETATASTVTERLAAASAQGTGDEELDALLKKYADVLPPQLPAGLPPDRGITTR